MLSSQDTAKFLQDQIQQHDLHRIFQKKKEGNKEVTVEALASPEIYSVFDSYAHLLEAYPSEDWLHRRWGYAPDHGKLWRFSESWDVSGGPRRVNERTLPCSRT